MNLLKPFLFLQSLCYIYFAHSDLERFVTKTCSHRNPSHDHNHMRAVKCNAVEILYKEFNISKTMKQFIVCMVIITISFLMINKYLLFLIPYIGMFFVMFFLEHIVPIYLLVITVAWLHDVNDHKYINPETTELTNRFLDNFCEKYAKLMDQETRSLLTTSMIFKIIERISFSREKEFGDSDWHKILGTTGTFIRNVVSDADKWESIGEIGITRCIEYTIEKFIEAKKIPRNRDVYQAVEKHYDEKLKFLPFFYMRTKYGKERAHDLNRLMIESLESFRRNSLEFPERVLSV
ncbi:MAG: metal dependent phosphohydrolase [Dasosvirus sp.]|uniref:Metal dependent phosphohydrolase n=1 Tax=Dasosvirus sp. TaxID=2487764 RepID=A0A3G4ZR71_9VIRU|nr:MAG: metal dependent phosphohydrolase [Dasosvirus sp.]